MKRWSVALGFRWIDTNGGVRFGVHSLIIKAPTAGEAQIKAQKTIVEQMDAVYTSALEIKDSDDWKIESPSVNDIIGDWQTHVA